jgi:hypothetical protein
LVANLPARFRKGKTLHRSEWIQLGYIALCFISMLAYLIAHLDFIGIEIPAWNFRVV